MPIYRGYSEDGSDAEEVSGAYISPNGKFWGSVPISRKKEQDLERFVDKRNSKRGKHVQKRNNNKYQ